METKGPLYASVPFCILLNDKNILNLMLVHIYIKRDFMFLMVRPHKKNKHSKRQLLYTYLLINRS